MSKIYEKYLALKESDPDKLYLFRCGNFYIFLADDADFINNYVVLKRTKFSKEVMKCGFPVGSKEEYLKVFEHQNLKIEVIENPLLPVEISEREKFVVNYLKNIEINMLTPIDAINKLKELQEMFYES